MTGVSQAEFARQIDRSRQYVSKLVKLGKLPTLEDGSIDPVIGAAVLKQLKDPARVLAKRNEQGGSSEPLDDAGEDFGGVESGDRAKSSYNQAAILHKMAQGQIAQLELRKMEGSLVDKGDVDREAFDCARMTRDRLMGLPDEIAGPLKAMASTATEQEIMVFVRNKIRDALMEAAVHVGEGT